MDRTERRPVPENGKSLEILSERASDLAAQLQLLLAAVSWLDSSGRGRRLKSTSYQLLNRKSIFRFRRLDIHTERYAGFERHVTIFAPLRTLKLIA